MQLKIVSGRSGSGKSIALRALEDLGYYCVDNLPVKLLPEFIAAQRQDEALVAVSIDIRNIPQDPEKINQILASLPEHVDIDIFFLDADNDVLVKRYSETRRLHPLSINNLSLSEAIKKESHYLMPLKESADKIIDTSKQSVHDLSNTIRSLILGKNQRELIIIFESFGFKHGLPSDADFVFDVRFLPNPHWDPALRPLTGLDEPVKLFFSAEKDVALFITQIKSFIETWLPLLQINNRSYLTIAIGCTGGQHRSVYIAQHLADYFKNKGNKIQTRHCSLEMK